MDSVVAFSIPSFNREEMLEFGQYVTAIQPDEVFVRVKDLLPTKKGIEHWNQENCKLTIFQDISEGLFWCLESDGNLIEKVSSPDGKKYYLKSNLVDFKFSYLRKLIKLKKPIPHLGDSKSLVSLFKRSSDEKMVFILEEELKHLFHKNLKEFQFDEQQTNQDLIDLMSKIEEEATS